MEGAKIYGHIDDVVIIGHGSIGKGVLPLIKRHFTFKKITIIDTDPVELPAESDSVQFVKSEVTKANYVALLDRFFVNKVGFLLNLSLGASSSDLAQYCQRRGAFYIDSGKMEWVEHYSNEDLPLEERSNYMIRHHFLEDVRKHNLKTTAISCAGANPGMVSWLVKQALLNIAKDTDFPLKAEPKTRLEWAQLMKDLGVKGVHVAERDTQRSDLFRPEKQFWNTWSVIGYLTEGYHLPSELGWGTHEKWLPKDARSYSKGCQAAIYMTKPGMNVTVKSWCPTYGPQFGFLITHDESISIADYFTLREEDKVVFRPTVHYAYHPCGDAIASALETVGSGEYPRSNDWKILEKEVVSGMDELGVLLYGHAKNAYWYGSQLDIESTRQRAPNQNATALQVTSAMLAGMVWALENPEAGLCEPDEMDFRRCLEVQHEYISPVNGYYTDWTPLHNRRSELVNDNFDLDDPWQFKNVLIHK
jgi:homospermidine synthase